MQRIKPLKIIDFQKGGVGERERMIVPENIHSFIQSWFMQQFSFNLIPPLLIDLIFTKECLQIFTKEFNDKPLASPKGLLLNPSGV